MDTTGQSPVQSPSAIYGKLIFSFISKEFISSSDAIFRDSLPMTTSNVRSDHAQHLPVLHSYNREILTKNNYPVYMTQQTFFRMLYTPDGHQWSRLESFLASSILVRQFAKAVNEPADANNPTVGFQIPLFSFDFYLNFRFV
jgi:hypothetical protein